jgi:CheY-like chemotaxis protein
MNQVILVVDDDTSNLALAQKILGKEYRIAAANSGAVALKYLENNSPDLILLDINMPEMDGFQVLEKMKQMEHFTNIPVIFLTADNDPETETRCFATGADLLEDMPALAQGPIFKIDPDNESYGDLYTIDVERDSDNGTHYTNPNLHRRVSDVVIDDDYMPYFHLEGTHEEIDYPDSEPCSVSNFKFGTDETTEKLTIQQYTGSQQNIQIPSIFVNAGYTTIGTGCFTDTDVVYVEIPEGITTIE